MVLSVSHLVNHLWNAKSVLTYGIEYILRTPLLVAIRVLDFSCPSDEITLIRRPYTTVSESTKNIPCLKSICLSGIQRTNLIKISPFILFSCLFLSLVKGSNATPFETRSGDLMICYGLTDQKISCNCFGAMGKRMLRSVLYRLR